MEITSSPSAWHQKAKLNGFVMDAKKLCYVKSAWVCPSKYTRRSKNIIIKKICNSLLISKFSLMLFKRMKTTAFLLFLKMSLMRPKIQEESRGIYLVICLEMPQILKFILRRKRHHHHKDNKRSNRLKLYWKKKRELIKRAGP